MTKGRRRDRELVNTFITGKAKRRKSLQQRMTKGDEGWVALESSSLVHSDAFRLLEADRSYQAGLSG